jgi:hypothetical protein
MRRSLLNTVLGVLGVWFALIDQCLIAAAGMPVTGPIVVLLLFQAGMFAFAMLLVNGAFPLLVAMAGEGSHMRMKIIVCVPMLILFLISPAMISDSMYRPRYGNIDKFLVQAHVAADLACCWNPLAAHHIRSSGTTKSL